MAEQMVQAAAQTHFRKWTTDQICRPRYATKLCSSNPLLVEEHHTGCFHRYPPQSIFRKVYRSLPSCHFPGIH